MKMDESSFTTEFTETTERRDRLNAHEHTDDAWLFNWIPELEISVSSVGSVVETLDRGSPRSEEHEGV